MWASNKRDTARAKWSIDTKYDPDPVSITDKMSNCKISAGSEISRAPRQYCCWVVKFQSDAMIESGDYA